MSEEPEISIEEYEQLKKQYKQLKSKYKKYKKVFEKDDDDKTDCGCGNKDCNCGDNCNCTPEHNCGCNCGDTHKDDCGCNHNQCGCGDDCKCTTEDSCNCNHSYHECHCGENEDGGEHCNCEGDCNCEANNQHNHCHCHNKPAEEEYQKLFTELQYALVEGEKQLQKARNEALDNQRIAVSYKKDLERYKERNANIEVDAKNNAVENVASKLIPILDQFEAALDNTEDTPERKGFEMIYADLKRVVVDLGIAEIEALDKEFDSNYHNAVNKSATKDKNKDGCVTAVYQKGYYILATNKIIRYAMVEVGEYVK